MAKRPGKREEAIDRGKLALALLKERDAYREFFKENSDALTVALNRYRNGYGRKEHNQTESDLEAMSEDSLFFNKILNECESRFGIVPPLSDWKISAEEVLLLLDPYKNVEDIPEGLELVLIELFSPERILQVAYDGVPFGVLMYEWASVVMLMPKEIEPYQRLLLIDMRGSLESLKKRFAKYLESVEKNRRVCPEDRLREDWLTYGNWAFDNSRVRKEAWQHLKVWHMRRNRKGFAEIARTMRMKEFTAKKRFYRAYELIEGQSYQPEDFRRDYWEIRKAELKRTCSTCPDKNNCTVLCPDVLPFTDQDTLKSTLGLTGGGIADVMSDVPLDGRERAHPTSDKEKKRLR